jgi:hypothetical protein
MTLFEIIHTGLTDRKHGVCLAVFLSSFNFLHWSLNFICIKDIYR